MRTRRMLVGVVGGALLVLVLGFLVRCIILRGARERAVAQAPKEQEPQGEVLPAPQPGKRIVSDVFIQGNRPGTTEHIKAQVKTRPGVEFSAAVLEEDVRTLFNTKQFSNVRADLRDDGPGHVGVYFLIREEPQTIEKITYQGAKHLSEENLAGLTELKVGNPMNPVQNRYACRKIIAKYNEDGRPFASCQLLKGGETSDTEVVFNITEGPKVAVRDIQFEGNTFVTSAVLDKQVQSSRQFLHLFDGKLNPQMLNLDLQALETYYHSFGFQDVKVSRELQWDPDGRYVVLVFHISEGLRYRMQSVPQVIGPRSVPPEQLEVLGAVKPLDYSNEPPTGFSSGGGQEVHVEPAPAWLPDVRELCTVEYSDEEPPPTKVGPIIIIGRKKAAKADGSQN
jgi:outer membrane protein insertion porin family